MKQETLEKAHELSGSLREVERALREWEEMEQPTWVPGVHGAMGKDGRLPKHLHDLDAWIRYRRAQIDYLIGQQRELQRQFDAL